MVSRYRDSDDHRGQGERGAAMWGPRQQAESQGEDEVLDLARK